MLFVNAYVLERQEGAPKRTRCAQEKEGLDPGVQLEWEGA